MYESAWILGKSCEGKLKNALLIHVRRSRLILSTLGPGSKVPWNHHRPGSVFKKHVDKYKCSGAVSANLKTIQQGVEYGFDYCHFTYDTATHI